VEWLEKKVPIGGVSPPRVPARFCGRGGSDEGCVFDVVSTDPMEIAVVSLSEFWSDPVRNTRVVVGERYRLRQGKGGWLFDSDGPMPWWFFYNDGGMDSH